MKLKMSAIQILVTGLQPREMGAIYLMGTGIKEMPETVTKSALTNIITFLCSQLDWIVNDEEKNMELSTKAVTKKKKILIDGKQIFHKTVRKPGLSSERGLR